MPVGVIHGTSEGPTVVVTGGLFPTEYAGVEAAARLYQTIHPSDLAGRLVVVPVVNMPCLQFRTPWFNLTRSISPMDGLSINSVFPGDPQGRVTQVVAHTLLHEIVLKGNYHVDLRGGDLNESHLVHTIFPKIGQEIDGTCEELAKVIGFEYVMPGTPDISHTSKSRLVYETVTRGVPSVITECGLGYRTQPREQEIVPHVEGVKNVLKHLGMMAGAPTRPRSQQYLDMSWQRGASRGVGHLSGWSGCRRFDRERTSHRKDHGPGWFRAEHSRVSDQRRGAHDVSEAGRLSRRHPLSTVAYCRTDGSVNHLRSGSGRPRERNGVC